VSTDPDVRTQGACGGTALGAAVLAGVLVGAVAVALVVGAGRPGWKEAVAFAALVAGVGGIGGWIVAHRATGDPARRSGAALAATALRVAPALAALAWLGTRGRALGEAGAGGLLVAFYLALLATAILLHMMVAREGSPPGIQGRR